MDYAPWGLLGLAAVVFGGVSIFALPPIALLGISIVAYYGWLHVSDHGRSGGHDPEDGPSGPGSSTG